MKILKVRVGFQFSLDYVHFTKYTLHTVVRSRNPLIDLPDRENIAYISYKISLLSVAQRIQLAKFCANYNSPFPIKAMENDNLYNEMEFRKQNHMEFRLLSKNFVNHID